MHRATCKQILASYRREPEPGGEAAKKSGRGAIGLPDDLAQYGAQCGRVGGRECAEGPGDEALLDGGEDGLENAGLDEPGTAPVSKQCFALNQGLVDLAGDGHDHEIGSLGVVAIAGDDDGWALLGAGLVGEGKGHEEHIAEGKAGGGGH